MLSQHRHNFFFCFFFFVFFFENYHDFIVYGEIRRFFALNPLQIVIKYALNNSQFCVMARDFFFIWSTNRISVWFITIDVCICACFFVVVITRHQQLLSIICCFSFSFFFSVTSCLYFIYVSIVSHSLSNNINKNDIKNVYTQTYKIYTVCFILICNHSTIQSTYATYVAETKTKIQSLTHSNVWLCLRCQKHFTGIFFSLTIFWKPVWIINIVKILI